MKIASLALGIVLLLVGSYIGLFVAPPEAMMGEVQRIMYVHVPAAWNTLVCYTIAVVASVYHLVKRSPWADPLAESAIEIGAVLNALTLGLGMLWGKPTWGAYWTWDPRLTATLIMWLSFVGYLALRRFVDQPDQRARWAAVYAIVAYANIPLVWFSVRWFRSLHQIQSTPETVAGPMKLPLRVNAFAFLFLAIAALMQRYKLAQKQLRQETVVQ